ncbi:Fungal chitosanase [Penicillium robsamsonii]|uniref:Fungal chitosanase n=1 Tax=Penicillium robsamsonii TaxID=1792511 RepID=UPI002546623A|nr:Fungal chitosanase [Penicillium robsamsonii]KAJ5807705.1 Fungal chitosanase [Penicillium robsamsonii]
MHLLSTLILSSVGLTLAYEVPDNLKKLYDEHKGVECKNILKKGLDDGGGTDDEMGYCGDIDGAIYLYSTANGGSYGDMDIDCDGANETAGLCSNDQSGQGQTAFKSELQKNYGIEDLDAGIHPYVVFGTKDYFPQGNEDDVDPKEMQPLSVMAVVCGGNLHYAIWGDTNGHYATGEASLSLGQLCFPDEDITGDSGHTEKDVLYIGFKGKSALPGDETNWKAKDAKTFEESIKSVGDKLVQGLGSAGSKGSSQGRVDDSSSSFTTSARTTTKSTTKSRTRVLSSTAPPMSTTAKAKSCRQH